MNTIVYIIISQGLNRLHGTSSEDSTGILTVLVNCTKQQFAAWSLP